MRRTTPVLIVIARTAREQRIRRWKITAAVAFGIVSLLVAIAAPSPVPFFWY